jgi:hypothetical protein
VADALAPLLVDWSACNCFSSLANCRSSDAIWVALLVVADPMDEIMIAP